MTMNLKNTILQSLFLIFPALLWAQGGLVNNGASIRITTSANLKINGGGVTNNNNGNINNEGNLYLDLDWIQSGTTTDYSGAGWMTFKGTANQNLSSVQPITIPMLRVNNGNRLILNDNVIVSTQVDLINNGSIQLGTNNLVLTPNATIINFDPSHFIITNNTGVLQQEVGAAPVIFPIGNSTYNPARMSNIGTVDNFMARVEDQVWDLGTTGTPETQDIVNRSWHITESIIGGSSATLTVQWNASQELIGFDRTQSGIAQFNSAIWQHPAAYTAATPVGLSFSQTRTEITSFSSFTVEDIKEILPIKLLFFEAHRLDKNNVQLNWATESELNNQGFDIERMLDTETAFRAIDWVDGAGNSTSLLNYSLNDPNPHQGISYYRLKQIDFDGSYTYSPIRAVEGSKSTDNSTIQIYPVPTKDHLTIDFSNWKHQNTTAVLKIVDVHGRVLLMKEIAMQQNHLIRINEVSNFSPGTYFVMIGQEETFQVVRKIIKY
jgi:hypothetical protein